MVMFKSREFLQSHQIKILPLCLLFMASSCSSEKEVSPCLPIVKQKGRCFIEGKYTEDETGFRSIETDYNNRVTISDTYKFEERFPDLSSGDEVYILSDFEIYNQNMVDLRGIKELKPLE